MLARLCNLPSNNSFFLFGARQCGKTTLIEEFLNHQGEHWTIDLLNNQVMMRLLTDPESLYREAIYKLKDPHNPLNIVFIDEVQRVPALLDYVQILMKETSLRFILSGSSARKLKRSGANLLGGRAIERHLFPMTYHELCQQMTLDDILRYGTIPGVVIGTDSEQRFDLLNSYVSTYLKEEVQQEALVRNIPGFATFLEVAAQQSGELLNFASVGRDAGLHGRTVQAYYQILEDTLIGIRLPAYRRSIRRRLSSSPKFYLFDIGIVNALERQLRSEPDSLRFGRLFEHFIVLETQRLLDYLSPDGRLYFWRTKDQLEVDLLVEHKGKLIAAVEIKSSKKVSSQYLTGLRSFSEEHPNVPCFVAARVSEPFELDGIEVLPWQLYLTTVLDWLGASNTGD